MKEAHDHKRVCAEGKKLGSTMSRLADKGCALLAAQDEPDARCKTCAFRAGTVPNGCLQTQMDVLKAITDDVPFLCHAHQDESGHYDTICHGWYASRWLVNQIEEKRGEKLPKSPWEFSPPDSADTEQDA